MPINKKIIITVLFIVVVLGGLLAGSYFYRWVYQIGVAAGSAQADAKHQAERADWIKRSGSLVDSKNYFGKTLKRDADNWQFQLMMAPDPFNPSDDMKRTLLFKPTTSIVLREKKDRATYRQEMIAYLENGEQGAAPESVIEKSAKLEDIREGDLLFVDRDEGYTDKSSIVAEKVIIDRSVLTNSGQSQ